MKEVKLFEVIGKKTELLMGINSLRAEGLCQNVPN